MFAIAHRPAGFPSQTRNESPFSIPEAGIDRYFPRATSVDARAHASAFEERTVENVAPSVSSSGARASKSRFRPSLFPGFSTGRTAFPTDIATPAGRGLSSAPSDGRNIPGDPLLRASATPAPRRSEIRPSSQRVGGGRTKSSPPRQPHAIPLGRLGRADA